jgi:hypothetical protein
VDAHTPEPTILFSIDDPVTGLDLVSALRDAGFRVLTPGDDPPRVWPGDLALAALGRDDAWGTMLPLVRQMRARQIPCLLLTLDPDGLPDELRDVAQLEKPFDSEHFLDAVRSLVRQRDAACQWRLSA